MRLKTPRLCPAKSTLKVIGQSKLVNLTLEASDDIVRNNPWGRTNIVVKLVYGGSVSVVLFGKVSRTDVKVMEVPLGIHWEIDENTVDSLTLKLSAPERYIDNSSLVLVDTNQGRK
jgi:hypothetical protein